MTEISFDDIVDRTKANFNPKPSPIVKRFELNMRCQREDESVSVDVEELRKLVEYCEYGRVLSNMLRDLSYAGSSTEPYSAVFYSNPTSLSTRYSSEAADKDSKCLNLSATPHKDLQIGKVKDGPSLTPPFPQRRLQSQTRETVQE